MIEQHYPYDRYHLYDASISTPYRQLLRYSLTQGLILKVELFIGQPFINIDAQRTVDCFGKHHVPLRVAPYISQREATEREDLMKGHDITYATTNISSVTAALRPPRSSFRPFLFSFEVCGACPPRDHPRSLVRRKQVLIFPQTTHPSFPN